MDKAAMLRILRHISEGDYSIERMASDTQLNRKSIVEFLKSMGLDVDYGEIVSFRPGDRLKTAVTVLKQGCSLSEVSKNLTWKDFEDLTSEILKQCGYSTQRNLHLPTRRFEIDVLAVREGQGLAIDCKHWRRNLGRSTISRVASQQIERVRALMASYLAKEMTIHYAIPVVMTLYAESIPLIHGVPIVPVEKFLGFLSEIDGNLENLFVVEPVLSTHR